MSITWSQDKREYVKERWVAGVTASQIAEDLGPDYTKNSVISIVHRMGLTARDRVARPFQRASEFELERKRLKAKPRVKHAVVKDVAPPIPLGKVAVVGLKELPAFTCDPPLAERVALLQLRDIHCRWPLGSIGKEDFGFCGRDKIDRSSYCQQHEHVARAKYRANEPAKPWEDK